MAYKSCRFLTVKGEGCFFCIDFVIYVCFGKLSAYNTVLLKHSVLFKVFTGSKACSSVNVLVFLMSVYKNACENKQNNSRNQTDECRRNSLEEVFRISFVKRILHHANYEYKRVVHSISVFEREDRMTYNCRIIVHHRCKFLCGDY